MGAVKHQMDISFSGGGIENRGNQTNRITDTSGLNMTKKGNMFLKCKIELGASVFAPKNTLKMHLLHQLIIVSLIK